MKKFIGAWLVCGALVGCVDSGVEREAETVVKIQPVEETKKKVIVSPGIVRDKKDVSEENTSGADLRFVGMTDVAAKELAESEGLKSRVVRVDGVARMVTRDFLRDRLNFEVMSGRVTRVTRG